MGAVDVLVVYELRRVLAKKRVLVLIAAVFLVEAGLYLVVTRLPPLSWDLPHHTSGCSA